MLDKSQPSRLLRTATCSLFFASFDPHTARPDVFPNVTGLHIDPRSASGRVNPETAASTNGKRVVIETDPENGTCTWRFVPRAKVEGDLLGDEGPWPRVVALCGHLVRMTQDQWDIHKLDPEYDCIVRQLPNLTTIMRVSHPSTTSPQPTPTHDSPSMPTGTPISLDEQTPTATPKRAMSPTFQEPDSPLMARTTSFIDPDQMAIDDDPFLAPITPAPANDVPDPKKRRRVTDRLGALPSRPEQSKSEPSGKRAGDGGRQESPSQVKRTRVRSPSSVKREMEQRRVDREKKRKADMNARLKARRDALSEAFWRNVGVVPMDDETSFPQSDDTEYSEACTEEDERIARIEESKRKLAELENDRPLWEESARRRQQREAQEELLRKREKKMREEEERLQEQIKSAQKQREVRLEQEYMEQEREGRIRQQRSRMIINQPRNTLRWNSRLALERYMMGSVDFDTTKFTAAERPMNFEQIPWPVLHGSYSVQDVDWDTVEAFFGEVQRFFSATEFKEFVEKSHRRFHPDRWRGRGLLASVKDEMERDILEVAGSTVAQALTPLWKEVTGRI